MMIVGIIAATAQHLYAFSHDPKVLLGGIKKVSVCILSQVINALCVILLGFFDKMPLAKKVTSCLVPLAPLLECLGDTFLSGLADDFPLDASQLSVHRIFKATKAAAEVLRGALAFLFLFWMDGDQDGDGNIPIQRLKGLFITDSLLVRYLVFNRALGNEPRVLRETRQEWEQAIELGGVRQVAEKREREREIQQQEAAHRERC